MNANFGHDNKTEIKIPVHVCKKNLCSKYVQMDSNHKLTRLLQTGMLHV